MGNGWLCRHFCVLTVVTGLAFVSGCSRGGHEKNPGSRSSGWISTGARIPDSCRLVDPALADELIAFRDGRRTKNADPAESSTTTECQWRHEGLEGASRKQGTIEASATVDLRYPSGGDPFVAAKIAYHGYTKGKNCAKIQVSASETCWYGNPGRDLTIVIRSGHVTVLVNCVADNSPLLSGKRQQITALRLAKSALHGLG